jgi:ATP-dependent RNA helicase DDX19/DBP5
MSVVRTMGKFTPVTTCFAIRDGVKNRSVIDAQVVVGTPGTILNLIDRKLLKIADICILAVDEADNMLDSQSLMHVTVRIKK